MGSGLGCLATEVSRGYGGNWRSWMHSLRGREVAVVWEVQGGDGGKVTVVGGGPGR